MKFFLRPRAASTLLLVVSIPALCLLTSCNSFQSLEYRGVSEWKVQAKSFAESKLSANIKVFNPNKYRVTVKRIEADILVNGSKWSNYLLDSSFMVPAQSEFTLPVNLRVKNASLLTGVSTLAAGKELMYELKGKIKGTFRSITAEVPFTYQDKFSEEDIRF